MGGEVAVDVESGVDVGMGEAGAVAGIGEGIGVEVDIGTAVDEMQPARIMVTRIGKLSH